MRIGSVEIHAQTKLMLESIKKDYKGDIKKFTDDVENLFIGDAYSLAGFADPKRPLPLGVQKRCAELGWDCTNKDIHKLPATQHINVDQRVSCLYLWGCSGNPYQQAWGLLPKGWGESHELGHNLQVDRLFIYGSKSIEVSNQIFPLHKNWRIFHERGEDLEHDRLKYRSAYDLIVAGHTETDPVEGVYKRIWGSPGAYDTNGERMVFYTQWVHYWADQMNDPTQGWNIWTLLYLHDRLLAKSDWETNKNALGYSTYDELPEPNIDRDSTIGNDNLLIALSVITQLDQRPTFALWGIRTSAAAQAQLDALDLTVQPAFFYANDKTANDHSTVIGCDVSKNFPEWPFPER